MSAGNFIESILSKRSQQIPLYPQWCFQKQSFNQIQTLIRMEAEEDAALWECSRNYCETLWQAGRNLYMWQNQ